MSLTDIGVSTAVSTLNTGGRVLGRLGMTVPDLTPSALMRAAQARAGLTSFGDWGFHEPLERLMSAYEHEADLTMLGRVTVRELIVSLLENLLYLEEERERWPHIETEQVASPVFVVGLPRTGTTLLHGLIAQDPENRVPRTWEVMFPAGYSDDDDEIRKAHERARSRLDWANRLVPEFKRIHPIAPELPQECIAITAQVFLSIQFHTTHNVPSYQNWLEREPQDVAYTFHHALLQHLQAKRPPRRWVLKAPGHLFALDALLRRYPDARIVHTHRDPLQVMASMASHATALRRAFSNTADPRDIAHDWVGRWANALGDFLSVRDRSRSEQFLDVHYDDIELKPLETVRRIYEFLGWPLSDAANHSMETFLAANPKDKHGVHRYSLAQYGLDRATELERFAPYCERFGITVDAE